MKFIELFNEDWTVNWDKITTIPQFEKLDKTKQSTVWHKEGDVLTHTNLVTSQMSIILNENDVKCGTDEWIMCMAAAICHDLGKGTTTKWSNEKNDWTTKNHGPEGDMITRKLFYDEDVVLREKVCCMVRHHMALHHVFDKPEQSNKILIKLSHCIVPIKYLLWLNEADSRGSINEIENEEEINCRMLEVLHRTHHMECYEEPYSIVENSQLIRNFIDYDGEVVNTTNDFCVYILCGFPGAGKTTYYKNYLSDKPLISRDVIRGELHIMGATPDNDKKVVGTFKDEERVSEVFNKKLIECCENKESCVIDNTNLRMKYRIETLRLIMKYNPLVKIIWIEAPDFLNACIERRKEQIGSVVYDRLSKNYDFPQLYECDELVIYKQFTDKDDETYIFSANTAPSEVSLQTQFLNDLKITRGAMILDGYDCYDSCVKYMDELIKKYQ